LLTEQRDAVEDALTSIRLQKSSSSPGNRMSVNSLEEKIAGHMETSSAVQSFLNRQGRKYRRFKLEFPVRLKFKIGSTSAEVEAVSKNLSVGGLLIRSAMPVPQHTAVVFVLSVHGSQSLRPIHLMGAGEIVRVENIEAETSYVIAVKCETPITELEAYLPMQ
jgi:hypothetical protein